MIFNPKTKRDRAKRGPTSEQIDAAIKAFKAAGGQIERIEPREGIDTYKPTVWFSETAYKLLVRMP